MYTKNNPSFSQPATRQSYITQQPQVASQSLFPQSQGVHDALWKTGQLWLDNALLVITPFDAKKSD